MTSATTDAGSAPGADLDRARRRHHDPDGHSQRGRHGMVLLSMFTVPVAEEFRLKLRVAEGRARGVDANA
jgi:hypothetical protein